MKLYLLLKHEKDSAPIANAWVYLKQGSKITFLRTDPLGMALEIAPEKDPTDASGYKLFTLEVPASGVELLYTRGARPVSEATLLNKENHDRFVKRDIVGSATALPVKAHVATTKEGKTNAKGTPEPAIVKLPEPIPVRFFVLVSQHDDTGHKKMKFEKMVPFRAIEILKEAVDKKSRLGALIERPTMLRFLHFDFKGDQDKGEIKVAQFVLEKSTKSAPSQSDLHWHELENEFDAGLDAGEETDPKIFAHDKNAGPECEAIGDKTRLSIVHVYHSVRGAPRGSVMEIGIYSHAWLEGPVLTPDSFDNDPTKTFNDGSPRRNPADKDCRKRTDFAPNMGEDPAVPAQGAPESKIRSGGRHALDEFKAKLHDNATFRVHGCNSQDPAFDKDRKVVDYIRSTTLQVLNQAHVHLNKHWPAKPPDKVRIDMAEEFKNENDVKEKKEDERQEKIKGYQRQVVYRKPEQLQGWHYAIDPYFFPKDKTEEGVPVPVAWVFHPTWSALLGFAARRMKDTYMFSAAQALTHDTHIQVFGALPGTYADNDPSDHYLHAVDGVGACEFFSKYMGVSSTKTKKYGVLNADAVKSVEALARHTAGWPHYGVKP
jgi:hypothetical protein